MKKMEVNGHIIIQTQSYNMLREPSIQWEKEKNKKDEELINRYHSSSKSGLFSLSSSEHLNKKSSLLAYAIYTRKSKHPCKRSFEVIIWLAIFSSLVACVDVDTIEMFSKKKL